METSKKHNFLKFTSELSGFVFNTAKLLRNFQHLFSMERGKALESDTHLDLTTGHSYGLPEPSSPYLYSGSQ